ncbi:NAD-dependent epimerase/dehydratase family protein [Anatilimnocola sp. NA78]|uniref:NAD-dependent epimerase/dehydratase family protein n=1 Tax=Anatilimnocola sp. NA78 TaxID=3415683 RepID=UPI003CE4E4FA
MTAHDPQPATILVTGATGKVGQHFCEALLKSPHHAHFQLRALCHQRQLPAQARVECVNGTIADKAVVARAMQGVTHVVHLATCKETPEDVMDVTVKGLFWLLESCRQSPTFQQFVLIGGDAALGHFVYPHPLPVTEEQVHSAYPGCYALSKVLEEVMLEQYQIQYELNGCCLRAPWIMEKDDFKYQLSFGDDVFGGPRWRDLVGAAKADEYAREGRVPVMLDPGGKPVQRNFVHVSDLVSAILIALDHQQAHKQTFNICCNEPVDYRLVANHLQATRGLPSVDVATPYHSTWLDNSKAKFLLGWRPQYDYRRLVDEAYNYQRAADNPRKIWYPG